MLCRLAKGGKTCNGLGEFQLSVKPTGMKYCVLSAAIPKVYFIIVDAHIKPKQHSI